MVHESRLGVIGFSQPKFNIKMQSLATWGWAFSLIKNSSFTGETVSCCKQCDSTLSILYTMSLFFLKCWNVIVFWPSRSHSIFNIYQHIYLLTLHINKINLHITIIKFNQVMRGTVHAQKQFMSCLTMPRPHIHLSNRTPFPMIHLLTSAWLNCSHAQYPLTSD